MISTAPIPVPHTPEKEDQKKTNVGGIRNRFVQGRQRPQAYQRLFWQCGSRWRWLERALGQQRANLRERGARCEWSVVLVGLAGGQRIFSNVRARLAAVWAFDRLCDKTRRYRLHGRRRLSGLVRERPCSVFEF